MYKHILIPTDGSELSAKGHQARGGVGKGGKCRGDGDHCL
jgi:hypothetical protein